MDDSAIIICDEIVDMEAKSNDGEIKKLPTILMKKNITNKLQNVHILLNFWSVTITLLITVSIYCYLIKYWAKRKHLLPFRSSNNKLKEPIHW